mgnify:CR=1 FL=1
MPQVKFPLKPLLEAVTATESFQNTADYDLLYDPKCYPDGIMYDKSGRTQQECDKADLPFFPDKSRMDKSLLPVSFALVGDQGVYLMPNKSLPDSFKDKSDTERFIVFAIGGDPNKDQDFYEFKRNSFGPDDGVVNIPLEWIQIAEKNDNDFLTINLSEKSISLISKPKSSKPKVVKAAMRFTVNATEYETVKKNPDERGAWIVKDVNQGNIVVASSSVLRDADWLKDK